MFTAGKRNYALNCLDLLWSQVIDPRILRDTGQSCIRYTTAQSLTQYNIHGFGVNKPLPVYVAMYLPPTPLPYLTLPYPTLSGWVSCTTVYQLHHHHHLHYCHHHHRHHYHHHLHHFHCHHNYLPHHHRPHCRHCYVTFCLSNGNCLTSRVQ